MVRDLPPLRLLTVFSTVMRSGSVQKAARALNVTQPAVSQALRSLEDHLGTRLLDRTTRPASLTDAGRILDIAVSDGLGRIAAAVERIRNLRRADEMAATIACSVGTATYWLMPRLAGFYAAHPAIAVNVMTTQGNPGVMTGVDLFIRFGKGDWSDGAVTKLFDERVVPVCTPALAEQLGDADGLPAATLLHVRSDDVNWMTWPGYLQLADKPASHGPARHFTNYVQATQAALAGQGVMLGWESNTGDLVRQGQLLPVHGATTLVRDAFYLVATDRAKSGAAQTLADWILEAVTPKIAEPA